MTEARKSSIYVTVGGGGGEGGRLGGGGQGTQERDNNKWKSARSTLKVRKNTIFFIEKILVYVEFVLFFVVVVVFFNNNNSIIPCNKKNVKYKRRLKARPTMLHIWLKRTEAASNEKTRGLQHIVPVQQGTSLLQKDYIGFFLPVHVVKKQQK